MTSLRNLLRWLLPSLVLWLMSSDTVTGLLATTSITVINIITATATITIALINRAIPKICRYKDFSQNSVFL